MIGTSVVPMRGFLKRTFSSESSKRRRSRETNVQESNIFCSEMVRVDYILAQFKEVAEAKGIIKLEIEDLIFGTRTNNMSLVDAVEKLIFANDRTWEIIHFVDSLDMEHYEEWNQKKQKMMRDYEAFGVNLPSSSLCGVIAWEARVIIPDGTEVSQVINIFKKIKQDKDIVSLEIKNTKGHFLTTAKEIAGMVDWNHEDGLLERKIILVIQCGWSDKKNADATKTLRKLLTCAVFGLKTGGLVNANNEDESLSGSFKDSSMNSSVRSTASMRASQQETSHNRDRMRSFRDFKRGASSEDLRSLLTNRSSGKSTGPPGLTRTASGSSMRGVKRTASGGGMRRRTGGGGLIRNTSGGSISSVGAKKPLMKRNMSGPAAYNPKAKLSPRPGSSKSFDASEVKPKPTLTAARPCSTGDLVSEAKPCRPTVTAARPSSTGYLVGEGTSTGDKPALRTASSSRSMIEPVPARSTSIGDMAARIMERNMARQGSLSPLGSQHGSETERPGLYVSLSSRSLVDEQSGSLQPGLETGLLERTPSASSLHDSSSSGSDDDKPVNIMDDSSSYHCGDDDKPVNIMDDSSSYNSDDGKPINIMADSSSSANDDDVQVQVAPTMARARSWHAPTSRGLDDSDPKQVSMDDSVSSDDSTSSNDSTSSSGSDDSMESNTSLSIASLERASTWHAPIMQAPQSHESSSKDDSGYNASFGESSLGKAPQLLKERYRDDSCSEDEDSKWDPDMFLMRKPKLSSARSVGSLEDLRRETRSKQRSHSLEDDAWAGGKPKRKTRKKKKKLKKNKQSLGDFFKSKAKEDDASASDDSSNPDTFQKGTPRRTSPRSVGSLDDARPKVKSKKKNRLKGSASVGAADSKRSFMELRDFRARAKEAKATHRTRSTCSLPGVIKAKPRKSGSSNKKELKRENRALKKELKKAKKEAKKLKRETEKRAEREKRNERKRIKKEKKRKKDYRRSKSDTELHRKMQELRRKGKLVDLYKLRESVGTAIGAAAAKEEKFDWEEASNSCLDLESSGDEGSQSGSDEESVDVLRKMRKVARQGSLVDLFKLRETLDTTIQAAAENEDKYDWEEASKSSAMDLGSSSDEGSQSGSDDDDESVSETPEAGTIGSDSD